MSGFMGFGQSGGESGSTGNINSIFNYALPAAKAETGQGNNNLDTAGAFFQKMLTGGRTQATQNAAPAVNAQQQQADTVRRQEAEQGTNRGGGTAGANREASTNEETNIDNIINQNLVGGRTAAATGLADIGGKRLSTSLGEQQIANSGQSSLYTGAINKEGAQGADFSKIISSLI